MELSENKIWNIKKTIEYSLERGNILFQLRYQLAFGIIILITGIWTVLASIYSRVITEFFRDIFFQTICGKIQNEFAIFLFLGWALTVVIITIWRYITHKIIREEHVMSITQINCLNLLGLLEEEILTNDMALFPDIENRLKLIEFQDYNSLTIEFKIKVMADLQDHIRDDGILLFDFYSVCFILSSWLLLITVFSNYHLVLSVISYLIWAICSYWMLSLIDEMSPSNHKTKQMIKKECNSLKNKLELERIKNRMYLGETGLV